MCNITFPCRRESRLDGACFVCFYFYNLPLFHILTVSLLYRLGHDSKYDDYDYQLAYVSVSLSFYTFVSTQLSHNNHSKINLLSQEVQHICCITHFDLKGSYIIPEISVLTQ